MNAALAVDRAIYSTHRWESVPAQAPDAFELIGNQVAASQLAKPVAIACGVKCRTEGKPIRATRSRVQA